MGCVTYMFWLTLLKPPLRMVMYVPFNDFRLRRDLPLDRIIPCSDMTACNDSTFYHVRYSSGEQELHFNNTIPGGPGEPATEDERARAAVKSGETRIVQRPVQVVFMADPIGENATLCLAAFNLSAPACVSVSMNEPRMTEPMANPEGIIYSTFRDEDSPVITVYSMTVFTYELSVELLSLLYEHLPFAHYALDTLRNLRIDPAVRLGHIP